jgi:hypothetical protein
VEQFARDASKVPRGFVGIREAWVTVPLEERFVSIDNSKSILQQINRNGMIRMKYKNPKVVNSITDDQL